MTFFCRGRGPVTASSHPAEVSLGKTLNPNNLPGKAVSSPTLTCDLREHHGRGKEEEFLLRAYKGSK